LRFRLKSRNSHLSRLVRWPPQLRRTPTLRTVPKTPPLAWTLAFAGNSLLELSPRYMRLTPKLGLIVLRQKGQPLALFGR
jgi:hypothetical protein